MKISTLRFEDLEKSGRLDSGYHLSAGKTASANLERLHASGTRFQRLGQPGGMGLVWQPNRFKRAYAAENEEALPYLRPYDVFEYTPRAADFLSVKRNPGIDRYRLRKGMILQSCSGRNLGPAVIVDRCLQEFLIGDDMLRVEIADEMLRYYVLSFLKTPTGQSLLRQGKTGSVIDHISVEHVAALQVPLLAENELRSISEWMRDAVESRESARSTLQAVQLGYESSLPTVDLRRPTRLGWGLSARKLQGRLDAASYDPVVETTRVALLKKGGRPISEVAEVLKPPGRYKTFYVSAEHGAPLLSGTQLLQHIPVNLQYIARRALKNREAYELRAGWIAYQADGRAEEALGLPIVITPNRDGWLASGHVGRVVARSGVSKGWLYAAIRTPHAQLQLKSLSSGSVVDATFPEDMNSVVLPPFSPEFNWQSVEEAWKTFSHAEDLEAEAVRAVEERLSGNDLRLV